MTTTPLETRNLRGWALLATVLCIVMFVFPMLLPLPLMDPDEGLHASIAQEMVERGDWVTPRFLGEAFLDKPVLFTWTQAVSLKCFGMNEAAVRFPGLMFGLLAVVVTGLIGTRMFSPKVGLISAVLYATMIIPTALTQAPTHDVALVPWVGLALLLFWEGDRAKSRRGRVSLALAIGVVLGLSCLTKGLVGIGLVGISYGAYLLAMRRLTFAACIRGAIALSVAAVVAFMWYLAMEVRNPGYLYYYFVERHLLGLATESQLHAGEPWWYYLPILLGGGLPWILYLPVGVRDWWAERGTREKPPVSSGAVALLLCWVVACTLLLSIAGSKLITYIWPVFPPIAILTALVWVRLLDGTLSTAGRRWFATTFWLSVIAGPVVLPVVMFVAGRELQIEFSPLQWTVMTLIGLAAWIPPLFWRRGQMRAVLASGTLIVAVQFMAVITLLGPQAAEVHSAQELAEHLNRSESLPPRVVIVNERLGSVVFYLDPAFREQLTAERLQSVSAGSLHEGVLEQGDAMVVVNERKVRKLQRAVDLTGLSYTRYGRYQVYSAWQLHEVIESAARGEKTTIR